VILRRWHHTTASGVCMGGWHSPPTGKPVLHFVHGNGFCSRSYEPLLAPLADHFDLWLVDLPGQGVSCGEPGRESEFPGWLGSAQLIEETLSVCKKHFAGVPMYALGHSFGGVATTYLMASQPRLFERTVLLDPVLFSRPMIAGYALFHLLRRDPPDGMSTRTRKRRHTWLDRTTAHAEHHERGIFRGWDERALHAHLTHAIKDNPDGTVSLRCPPNLEAAIFTTYPRKLWRTLHRVSTPTLVLHGDTSYPFVAKSTARWTRRNTHVSAQLVSGGHCFMQQNPDDTAQRVLGYLLAPHVV
jgi:pimeloyl-ACP methyl ester carboxylesterase